MEVAWRRGQGRVFPFHLHLFNNYLMLFVDRIRVCIAFAVCYLLLSPSLSISTNLPHMFQIKMANELESRVENSQIAYLGFHISNVGQFAFSLMETIYLF